MSDARAALEGSAHFHVGEFRCHHCGAVVLSKELVWRLEFARTFGHTPMRIVSGYRCRVHNAAVGGARDSMHLTGRAADLERGRLTVEQAQTCGFRGIGRDGIWAVHVDVRQGATRIFDDR